MFWVIWRAMASPARSCSFMTACPAKPRTPHVASNSALPPTNTPSATFHTNPVELAIYGTPKQSGGHSKGCRGSAPTETPHTRWRRFGPGAGRAATGGSASGPAITLDNRSWRRAIKVATSITSACTAGKAFLAALVLQRFRGCPDRASPRSSPIIRRHSCACAAVSDSHARSCGSSSRPSGVTNRPPLNEKPAQGPVRLRSRTIRLHATAGLRIEARCVPATLGSL